MSTLLDLVDSRVGIVRGCARIPKDWREPPRPVVVSATLSNFDFRKAHSLERMTSGKALTEEEAVDGAIVEALERYCAMQRRPGANVSGRPSMLDHPAILPEELVLYSDRQQREPGFRFRTPAPDAELTWVLGQFPGSGEPVYAPAALVYMNFAGAEGRELFARTNTSGLGGGADLAGAVLAGIYELVERDAFMTTWLARVPAPHIDFAGHDGAAEEIRAHYEHFGVELRAFDITTDLEIPAVMAVAVDHSGALPAAVVGLGCNLDPGVALDRAAMEIVQVRTGLVPTFREQPPQPLSRYDEVRELADHAAFAANPSNLHEFDFLLGGNRRVPLVELPNRSRGSVEHDLALCREYLEAAGSTVAFVDLTMPDLAAFPVRIVRAIATGLQPIHFGFGEERLGGSRLFAGRDLTEADVNPCPHPVA